MQVVYHLGVHATDEDRLIRSLLKTREELAARGVSVPAPNRYRALIRQVLAPLKGEPAPPDAQQSLLAGVCDTDTPQRIVFSHDGFICLPARALSDEGLYAQASRRLAALANLFPDAECEFHMALRNPATLVPALLARSGGQDYAAFMHDQDPARLGWAPMVRQIRQAVPRARLVLWCDEDSPILWGDILLGLAGPGLAATRPAIALRGLADQIDRLITPEGRALLRQALETGKAAPGPALRGVLATHLERFALSGALETEIALPGWDAALIAEMTANYDHDIAEIGAMAGVDLILP